MMQTRWMSLAESMANVVVGYVVAVATQMLVFPLFGMHPTFAQNLWIGLIFHWRVSARSYLLRRGFEALRMCQAAGRPLRPNVVDGIVQR